MRVFLLSFLFYIITLKKCIGLSFNRFLNLDWYLNQALIKNLFYKKIFL